MSHVVTVDEWLLVLPYSTKITGLIPSHEVFLYRCKILFQSLQVVFPKLFLKHGTWSYSVVMTAALTMEDPRFKSHTSWRLLWQPFWVAKTWKKKELIIYFIFYIWKISRCTTKQKFLVLIKSTYSVWTLGLFNWTEPWATQRNWKKKLRKIFLDNSESPIITTSALLWLVPQ